MNKYIKLVVSPLLFLPIISSAQSNVEIKPLSAQKIHAATVEEVIQSLSKKHYNKVAINDRLSSQLLDSYIKSLDPSRSYFYQSDIQEFEEVRYTLDDELKSGDVSSGYLIYNRFQKRIGERIHYSIDRLESGKRFDFTLNEEYETDRENSNWVSSTQEMNNLWRQRLKSSVLSLTLNDQTDEEAKDTIIKRNKSQLTRVSQTNSEDVFQIYVNNLTRLYDPHTAYFSPRSSENFKINMSLSLQGIGAVLQSEDEFTKIVRLIPSGPADKTGKLKANDKIVGVGQGANSVVEDIIGWRLDDVVQKIRGKKGTVVKLEVLADNTKSRARKTILITRDKVKLEEQSAQKKIITTKVAGKQYRIGVIDIPTFYIDFAGLQRGEKNYKSTTRDVRRLIEELKREEIDGLLIDLRNNGGGALQEANELAGLFIKVGATVQIKYSNGSVGPLYDRDPSIAYTGPLGVMVNRSSASASEIFAGAIQDHRRGIVIGSQTFGKGTVQTLSPLNHGQLKLTNAKFFRISGESTQNKGVMPDISLPASLDKNEFGESSLDNALPWDTVRSVKGFSNLDLSSFFDKVNALKQKRIDNLPDFKYIQAKISHNKELKKTTKISLNKKQYKKNLAAEKLWLLETENTRRTAVNLPILASFDQIEDSFEKDELGRPIRPEAKAILSEGVRILIDMKNLLKSRG